MKSTEYKASRFNVAANSRDDRYLIFYNLLSGSLIHGEMDEKQDYEPLIDPSKPLPEAPETLKQLEDLGFIVKKEKDELKELEGRYFDELMDSSRLMFTIVPTINCDLNCQYCYQVRQKSGMTDDIWGRVLNFIKKKMESEPIKSISTGWIGGEPLLYARKIRDWQKRLCRFCEANELHLQSSISTNGYLLGEEVANQLAEVKIFSISTTLAGDAEFHDKLRPHGKRSDSFERTFSNIKALDEKFNVIVSVNVGSTNQDSVFRLLDRLQSSDIRAKYSLVLNRIEPFDAVVDKDLAISVDEFMPAYFKLSHEILDRNLPLALNTRFGMHEHSYCNAPYKNSFVVNWEGDLFKCPEFGTVREVAIGKLLESGEAEILEERTDSWSINPFKDELCKDCGIIAYCYGGCLQKRNKSRNFCPQEKNHFSEMLQLYDRWLQCRECRK